MLSRGEESCGEVGLNSGFSGFFMVGDDMSGQRGAGGGQTTNTEAEDTGMRKIAVTQVEKKEEPAAVRKLAPSFCNQRLSKIPDSCWCTGTGGSKHCGFFKGGRL